MPPYGTPANCVYDWGKCDYYGPYDDINKQCMKPPPGISRKCSPGDKCKCGSEICSCGDPWGPPASAPSLLPRHKFPPPSPPCPKDMWCTSTHASTGNCNNGCTMMPIRQYVEKEKNWGREIKTFCNQMNYYANHDPKKFETNYCFDYNDDTSSQNFTSPFKMTLEYSDINN